MDIYSLILFTYTHKHKCSITRLSAIIPVRAFATVRYETDFHFVITEFNALCLCRRRHRPIAVSIKDHFNVSHLIMSFLIHKKQTRGPRCSLCCLFISFSLFILYFERQDLMCAPYPHTAPQSHSHIYIIITTVRMYFPYARMNSFSI